MSVLTPTVNDFVATTRAAQDLPDRVEDPAAVARVAAVLAGAKNGNVGPLHGTDATTTTAPHQGSRHAHDTASPKI